MRLSLLLIADPGSAPVTGPPSPGSFRGATGSEPTPLQKTLNRTEYSGFIKYRGDFGQVDGSTNPSRVIYFPGASRGGTQMNVMGLDGGVTVVYSNTFPILE